MRSAYWPGFSLVAGKLKRPSFSLTTVKVMVDPDFLALIRTPSSGTRPAETWPDSAGEAVCAATSPDPASHAANTRKPTLVTIERRGMATSLISFVGFYDGDCRGRISLGPVACGAEPVCNICGTIAKPKGHDLWANFKTGEQVSIDQARGDSTSTTNGFTAFLGNATVDAAYAPYGIFVLRVAVGIDWIVHAFLKTYRGMYSH